MARALHVLLLAAAGPLIVPALAAAATVSLHLVPHLPDNEGTPQATYTAGPGETNQLTATGADVDGGPGTGEDFTVADPGATITAGANCRALDAHHATCTAPPAAIGAGDIAADLGDGNDRAAGVSGADGGPGDDVLSVVGSSDLYYEVPVTGGPGDDVISGPGPIHGGAGDDTLTTPAGVVGGGYPAVDPALYGEEGDDTLSGPVTWGGPGADALRGTPGADALDGGPGPDRLDGGAGEDAAGYADSPAGVRVDLRHPADAGAPGEHDQLTGIEDVNGSSHHDVITGDAGRNVLDADQLGGDDVVSGGPGDDIMVGGPNRTRGRTTLRGGAGDDAFHVSLHRDAITCGPGVDTVQVPAANRAGRSGLVRGACERVATPFDTQPDFLGLPRRGHGGLHADAIGPSCRGTLTLRGADRRRGVGVLWGRGGWHRPRRATGRRRLVVHLTPAGRRAVRRHRIAVERMFIWSSCRQSGRRGRPDAEYTWRARL